MPSKGPRVQSVNGWSPLQVIDFTELSLAPIFGEPVS
ncbi:hypothetical protein BP1258A_2121 [Burkholderia pseudomallei 1258a]|uniref:Uncharacterized protein n=1 Tax=Burkholderia pseudomallei (strain 1026b) TaxID=884204 RepID=A0A0H3HMN2_BURP2|nr:hypothetical protein BP1026B_I2599 [Burkholderia pseudomallei 1026b]EIF63219.1 hypothetical protein BP1258A_2121 [Burkholderia pseudomallei 1258a]EIF64691.1 hypothetical protein BP1258B_2294 [Burkholderia pseudomallei 1258b]EIF65258.1 hypothetical protein BP1026A_1318 [Burkholderia pseudomallei 1026a]